MDRINPSRTAAQNAAFRAAESAKSPERRLVFDPYAIDFLPADLAFLVRVSTLPIWGRILEYCVDRRWPGARTSVLARTSLIDDWVCAAAEQGIDQIVMLGAGFDSRAWRLPQLRAVKVFEVDHPNTSAAKREKVARWRLQRPDVTFVAVDFDREAFGERLISAGFDGSRRAIIVWDGVSNYLQAQSVDEVVRWAGSQAGGGKFIFTYVHSGILDGTKHFEGAKEAMSTVKASNEPWTFGMSPEIVASYLRQRGLDLLEDLGADDYRNRIMGSSARAIHGYGFYRAALAEVAGSRPPAVSREADKFARTP